jgi:hypothetical protein
MNPFELFIELKTPMVPGRNPIRLDGLIWHCLLLEHGCPDKAQLALDEYLESTGRFYHASSAAFAVVRQQALLDVNGKAHEAPIKELIGMDRATIGSMSKGDLYQGYFPPNSKRGSRYTTITTEGGPYITRLTSYKAYWADGLVFHAVGKGKAVADLLQLYLAAVGVNANIGFGTIGRVVVRPTSEDYSLIGADNKIARPIPTDAELPSSDYAPARVADAMLTPPFRHQGTEECYMPESVRIIHTNHPFV